MASETPRRRRRQALLAIYERAGEHVVLDLAGTSDNPEVFRGDLDRCVGFIDGAVWSGRAQPLTPAQSSTLQRELGQTEGEKT